MNFGRCLLSVLRTEPVKMSVYSYDSKLESLLSHEHSGAYRDVGGRATQEQLPRDLVFLFYTIKISSNGFAFCGDLLSRVRK